MNYEWSYEPVPEDSSQLFRLCWQMESWLRFVVYVELRAARPDWQEPIRKHVNDWPPRSLANDKKLHHMATAHQAALSYLTFGQLWLIIEDVENWPLFEPYFPPRQISVARILEVKAIRNRVAHFREPNPRDVQRLRLFLEDLEPGFRRFSDRYSQNRFRPREKGQSSCNPVFDLLRRDWGFMADGIEFLAFESEWLYAPEPHKQRPQMNARLSLLLRPEQDSGTENGAIYMLHVSQVIEQIDAGYFLEASRSVHEELIHIVVSNSLDGLLLTIPAVHGPERVAELVFSLLNSARDSQLENTKVVPRGLRFEWPEYVLWLNHFFAFPPEDRPEVFQLDSQ